MFEVMFIGSLLVLAIGFYWIGWTNGNGAGFREGRDVPQAEAIEAAHNAGFTEGWTTAHRMSRDPADDEDEEEDDDLDDTDLERRERMMNGCA